VVLAIESAVDGRMSVREVTWKTKKGTSRRWLVDYTDQDGTRCFKNFKLKKDADLYHAQVSVEVHQGIHTAPSKSPTVAEAAEKWLQRIEARKRERSTIRQYQQHRDHIVKRIGSVKLAQLTPSTVEDFRDRLQLDLSRPLARKILTSFKSMLRVAKRSHVAADVSIERDKREDQVEVGRDLPSNAEVRRLIEAIRGNDPRAARMRALLLTAAFTGLRASELRGLRWEDIDTKAAVLHVRQRADRYNKIGKPKSAKSRRTIPLDTANLLPALRQWHLASQHKSGLVFATSTGAVEHHKNMLRSLESLMRAAKVVDKEGKPKYAIHAFRHYFASWCLNPESRGGLGMPPQDVQRLLGHSSIVMTLDVYGHLFPGGDHHSKFAAGTRAIFA
jgi:integrase